MARCIDIRTEEKAEATRLLGQKIDDSKLVVAEIFDKRPDTITKYNTFKNRTWVRCECECGKEVTLPFYHVRSGMVMSCGCKSLFRDGRPLAERRKEPNLRSVMVTFMGATKSLTEWHEITGIKYSTLRSRHRKGMPPEKLFFGYEGVIKDYLEKTGEGAV